MNRRGHKGRTDGNHSEIVQALRKAGIGAVSTASVGDGFGDVVAGFRGVNVLLELKREGKKLTVDEVRFHETWPGQIAVVETPEEAIATVLEQAKAAGRI
jgi:Holliday junction resolvase